MASEHPSCMTWHCWKYHDATWLTKIIHVHQKTIEQPWWQDCLNTKRAFFSSPIHPILILRQVSWTMLSCIFQLQCDPHRCPLSSSYTTPNTLGPGKMEPQNSCSLTSTPKWVLYWSRPARIHTWCHTSKKSMLYHNCEKKYKSMKLQFSMVIDKQCHDFCILLRWICEN